MIWRYHKVVNSDGQKADYGTPSAEEQTLRLGWVYSFLGLPIVRYEVEVAKGRLVDINDVEGHFFVTTALATTKADVDETVPASTLTATRFKTEKVIFGRTHWRFFH